MGFVKNRLGNGFQSIEKHIRAGIVIRAPRSDNLYWLSRRRKGPDKLIERSVFRIVKIEMRQKEMFVEITGDKA